MHDILARPPIRLACLVTVAACGGEGTWAVETWGEDYIEREIPSQAFADGCRVRFDAFVVAMSRRVLVDGDGAPVGALEPAAAYDVVEPGPTPMGEVAVPADHYDEVLVEVAPGPAEDGASVRAAGTLTCDGTSAVFDWAFDATTTYRCAPDDLTIPPGGVDRTQITIHGDHLFYDGLENPDAAVRGREILAADADADGEVTLDELDAVPVPPLGFDVGRHSDVLTLRQFVSRLSQTLVHVDGEGECLADRGV